MRQNTTTRRSHRDRVFPHGRIEIRIHDIIVRRDARGRFAPGKQIKKLARRVVVANLVVAGGLTWLCERMRAGALQPITNYQLGTDATTPAAGQTALIAASYSALFTKSNVAGSVLTIMLHLGRTQGNGPTYVEGGMFTGDGTMVARGTFSGVSKVNTQTMTIVHTITFSAS